MRNHQPQLYTANDTPRVYSVRSVIALICLAALLTWALPGDVVARSTFQSPPGEAATPTHTATSAPPTATATATSAGVTATATPTQSAATVTPTSGRATGAATPSPTRRGTVTGTVVAQPSPTAGAAVTATATLAAPAPTPAPNSAGAPAAPGFLPAPTLSAPGGVVPLLPGPQQPLAAPPAERLRPTSPATSNSPPAVATLIDNAIVALSYVWLCCGVIVLVVAGLVLVWLARRGRRGRGRL